jgi:hypothetical protein
MTIYDFSQLGRTEKVKLLLQKAIIIELYIEKETTRQVYSIDDFLVEVIITEGKVLDYVPFMPENNTFRKSLFSSQ